jgi:hypothetical protein
MSIPSVRFSPTSIADLIARTEYEAWLLEAVYDITDQRIEAENKDQLIYPPNSVLPIVTVYPIGINSGDWRPGFLEAGAPLIFMTLFKILDMLLEWILVENGYKPTFRFAEKIANLKIPNIQFPKIIDTNPWLIDRLNVLYEKLVPLRGTIIHARHFKSSGGNLNVSSSRGGLVGSVISIGGQDLRNLAIMLVSLLRYLEGTWTFTEYGEKRIKYALDELVHLHSLPLHGQILPGFLNVRVYILEGDSIQCDLASIRLHVSNTWPAMDMMFDLRLVSIASDGSHAVTYLIPWIELKNAGPQFNKRTAQPFIVNNPAGLDLINLARELSRSGGLAS